MNIDNGTRIRLQSLARVVARERDHLNTTTSRFSRLQKTIGGKMIPQLLNVFGENPATAMDNLDKAERLAWIPSSDEWQAIRKLRNQMVHEYIEGLEILTSAIQAAQQFVPTLSKVTNTLLEELKNRGWGEGSV